MATRLRETDVVMLGVGLVGSVVGRELTRAGLEVVGLERGEPRYTVPDFQGPAMHDKTYLVRTAELFAAIIGQVQAALARGLITEDEVRLAVHVDEIGLAYTPDTGLDENFHGWVGRITVKAMQEVQDGAARINR